MYKNYWFSDHQKRLEIKLFAAPSLIAISVILASSTTTANAMDLKSAVQIALQSNPEIAEASANRRAIDFEYEQARQLNRPSLILEGRFGPELVDSRTTRILGNDEDVLFGRQASATIQQNLLSFGRNNAERDRQASRVDSAAFRVRERSELVSLDVVQAYLDTMRLREIANFADQNVAFHENKVSEIMRGVSGGVKSESDAQQARERLSAAKISRSETEEAMDIAEADFRRVVGQNIGQTQLPQSISTKVPGTLEQAIGEARSNNPTLHIANTDLDTARAQYRLAKADLKPELLFEVVGRAGDDIGGFRDTSNDVRAQLRLQYEFRGGIKSSVVQEQINRVDEARARIMTLERNVENLVRESWAIRNRTSRRVMDLELQVSEGTSLLDSYSREFSVNRRTLLDILDAEASLFQAKTALSTAKYADIFAQYRLLAATGTLLDAFNVTPPREADASLRALEKIAPTPPAETEPRRYPNHFDDTMGKVSAMFDDVAQMSGDQKAFNVTNVKVRPITRRSASPEERKLAVAAIDSLVDYQQNIASNIVKTTELSTHIPRVATAHTSSPSYIPQPKQTSPSVAAFDEPIKKYVVEIYTAPSPELTIEKKVSPAPQYTAELSNTMLESREHVVKKGDTLYSIARKNNLTINALKRSNNLSEDNVITTGQTLHLPLTTQKADNLNDAKYSAEASESKFAEARTHQSARTINRAQFEALRRMPGAKRYPSLNAVFLEEKMYFLDE